MTELGDKLRAIRQRAIDDGTLVPGESDVSMTKEQNYRNALLRIIRIQEDCGESYEELFEAAQVARAVLAGFDHEPPERRPAAEPAGGCIHCGEDHE